MPGIRTLEELERVLGTQHDTLTRELVRAFAQLKRDIGENALRAALLRGPTAVAALVKATLVRPALSRSLTLLQRVVEQSARISVASVTTESLTTIHQNVVAAAEANAGRLVTQLTASSRAGLRQAVIDATKRGLSPDQLARELRPMVGLTKMQARSVALYREYLIKNNVTGTTLKDRVAAFAAKKIRQRASAIAETELTDHANLGTLTGWRTAAKAKMLSSRARKMWMADSRACPICRSLDGQKRRLNELFSSSRIRRSVQHPPIHTRCRCALGLSVH